MNAIAHDFPIRGGTRPDPIHSLAVQWELLCDAGARVADLAGLANGCENRMERVDGRDLVQRIEQLGGWQLRLMEQHIADLSAVMQPGLLTLETLAARGRSVGVGAEVLWRQFTYSHAAVLQVVGEPA